MATGSQDTRRWRPKLRDDVRFSNGKPITVKDIKFTYAMLKQDGMKFDHSFIQSIDIVDGHTIAFTLSQPGF